MVTSFVTWLNVPLELLDTIIGVEVERGSVVLVSDGEFKLTARAPLTAEVLGLSRTECVSEYTVAACSLNCRDHVVTDTGPVHTTAMASSGSIARKDKKRSNCRQVHLDDLSYRVVIILEPGEEAEDFVMRDTDMSREAVRIYTQNLTKRTFSIGIIRVFLVSYEGVETVSRYGLLTRIGILIN